MSSSLHPENVVESVFENAYLRDLYERITEGDNDGNGKIFAESEMTLTQENVYLKNCLRWEDAQQETISQQLDPPFVPLDVNTASDEEIDASLRELVSRMKKLEQYVVFAGHLSNRRLYELLVNDVLDREIVPVGAQYWYCCFHTETERLLDNDFTLWLAFYATPDQREVWQLEHPDELLPPYQTATYQRDYMPADPTAI